MNDRSAARRWSIRVVWVVAVITLLLVVGFQVARPRLEAFAVRRLQAAAARRGWTATVGNAHLSPRLTLDLRDIVLRNGAGVRVEAHTADVHPRWSWRGLTGHAALVGVSKALVYLPGDLRMDVRPTTWIIDSFEDRVQAELAGGGPPIALSFTNGNATRIDARFVAAPLSDLVGISRAGCPVARLGTVDGTLQLARSSQGLLDIRVNGRTRGAALASLPAEPPACPADPFGSPQDVHADVRATLEPDGGRATISQLVVRTRGIDASLQGSITGGTSDPRIAFNLEVPRMDLAEVLATAGLDLPAQDLGAASLSWKVEGRLLAPESLVVSQQLDFVPPAHPVPAIQRLKGSFVHRIETEQGTTRQILVSPQSPDFVALPDVPALFVKALLLAEDTDFYGHHGVDLRELPTAMATNFVRGTFVRGASTIPQQLAKNLFLTRKKTVSRKVEEAALALLLDSALGKARMLEIYLNVIEWGPGIYGLRPAARHYFDREPSQLTPRQMAFLVVLIPGPVKYQRSFATGTPTPFFEGMIDALLGKLQAVGALSDEAYQAALETPLDLRTPSAVTSAPEDQQESARP